MFSENYPKQSIIRVSNFIRLVDENHIRFDPSRGDMKSVLEGRVEHSLKDLRLQVKLLKVFILENPFEYIKIKVGFSWKYWRY